MDSLSAGRLGEYRSADTVRMKLDQLLMEWAGQADAARWAADDAVGFAQMRTIGRGSTTLRPIGRVPGRLGRLQPAG
jgi:hypothetical protein